MTQYDPGLFEPTDSGMQLATDLNGLVGSLHTNHKGPARPAYVRPGMLWIDDAGAAWLLKLYDGTEDAILATIDPATHKVTTAGVPASRKVKTGSAFLLNDLAGTNAKPAEADLTADLLFKMVFASVADSIAGQRDDLPVHPAGLKAAIAAHGAGYSHVFTSVASGSWVVPDGVTEILVALWGGGGGGGAYYNASYGGGNGGLGGFVLHSVAVTPGQSIPFTIGAGGAGSTSASVVASNGGNSAIPSLGLAASGGGGGGGGTSSTQGTSGAPGAGAGGNIINGMANAAAPRTIVLNSYGAWVSYLAAASAAALINGGTNYVVPNSTAGNTAARTPDMSAAGAIAPGAQGGGGYNFNTSLTAPVAGGGNGGAIMIIY